MDAQQLEDGVGRDVLLERRVIEAGIERGAGRGRRGLDVVADGLGRRHIVALPVAGHRGEVAVLVEDGNLDRLHLSGVGRRRHQGEADLLAGLEVLDREDGGQRVDDLRGLARLGADLGEQAHQIVAAADGERLGLGAGQQLVELVILVGGIVVGRFLDHGGVG